MSDGIFCEKQKVKWKSKNSLGTIKQAINRGHSVWQSHTGSQAPKADVAIMAIGAGAAGSVSGNCGVLPELTAVFA